MSDETKQSFPADALEPSADVPAGEEKQTPAQFIFDYVEILVFSICFVLILFMLVGRLCRVSGDSMRNTLHDNELLIITSLGEIERGDIVVLHQTSSKPNSHYNEPLVKRVIAMGGDTLRIDYNTSKVYLNGEELIEPYAALMGRTVNGDYMNIGRLTQAPQYAFDRETLIFEVTVPEGCYFVMGDNRNNSADSRVSEIGFVDERRVLGRAVLRVNPFTTYD